MCDAAGFSILLVRQIFFNTTFQRHCTTTISVQCVKNSAILSGHLKPLTVYILSLLSCLSLLYLYRKHLHYQSIKRNRIKNRYSFLLFMLCLTSMELRYVNYVTRISRGKISFKANLAF